MGWLASISRPPYNVALELTRRPHRPTGAPSSAWAALLAQLKRYADNRCADAPQHHPCAGPPAIVNSSHRDAAAIPNLRKSLRRRWLRGALVARFPTTPARLASWAPAGSVSSTESIPIVVRVADSFFAQTNTCRSSAPDGASCPSLGRPLVVRSPSAPLWTESRVATALRTPRPFRSSTEGVPVGVLLLTSTQHLDGPGRSVPRLDSRRAPLHNGSVELTGRPAALPRPELRPGRPAAHFRRYADTVVPRRRRFGK